MGSRRKNAAASEAARLLSQLGARKGGKASAAALTPEERKQRARTAVAARWKGRRKPPIDQTAVLARLGPDPVALRIAPGGGGKRRRAAIDALVQKGLIRILDVGSDSVTIARPAS